MHNSGPSRKVRGIVHARSHKRCEFRECGLEATEIHHRYERGMGGFGPKSPAVDWINQPSNLLDTCQHHNQWCSNFQPHEAWQMGWIIKEVNGEPELPWTVPVVTAHHPMPIFLSNVNGDWAVFPQNLPEFHQQPFRVNRRIPGQGCLCESIHGVCYAVTCPCPIEHPIGK